MERSNIQTLKQLVEQFMRGTPLHRKLQERRLMEGWKELMGRAVEKATGKMYIRDRILYVHLKSSVLRQELYMLRDDILNRLNQYTGEETITGIVFR